MITSLTYNALLTLAIPVTLEEDVLDFLTLHPQWARGFTIVDAEGMGSGATLLSTMEKVQGRCRRKLVLIAGVDSQLRDLLEALAAEIRNPDVAWWITALSGFGRLH
ncbi:hypothetical protein IMCC9480_26 [Oxalobacteraceae bacterium IMCC9480]|nr:hypothetical protein IMCC9480_26 [Oxalobacteraceae bacterium IMCC9480]NDP59982.1 DUF3240 domain-containing protein [Oxalobacteraceae bacterium]